MLRRMFPEPAAKRGAFDRRREAEPQVGKQVAVERRREARASGSVARRIALRIAPQVELPDLPRRDKYSEL